MFANAMKVAGAVAAVATAFGIATATSTKAQLSGTIEIDGSSTVFPITQKMADLYSSEQPGVDIAVGVSGTGGGFRKFCAGETVISNASRAVRDSERAACTANGIEFTEVLVGTDALTVVVSRLNSFLTDISSEELSTLWGPDAEGEITRWNQVKSSWPNAPIRLYGPGVDSGTFDFFTDEINGEEGASRADYTASEDDNILVRGVARDRFALAYFGLAYYLENDDTLRALRVDGVEPTPENAKSGAYSLARPLYIYVRNDAMSRPEVRDFVTFYLQQAKSTNVVTEVGYVPVEPAEYDAAAAEAGITLN